MSQPPLPSPDGPQAAATAAPWLLGTAAASLICGILSLLLVAAFYAGALREFFTPNAASTVVACGVTCGAIGVVLGHLVRAQRAMLGGRGAVLATAGLVLSYGGTLLPLALIALVYLAFLFAGPFPLAP